MRHAGPALVSAVRAGIAESSVALAPHGVKIPLHVFFADYLMVADACCAELYASGNAGPDWTEFARATAPHRETNIKRALRDSAQKQAKP